MAFWKIVVSLDRDNGRGRRAGTARLQAQAFVMSQEGLVKPEDLEIVFGRGFETYQITVEQLERMTGLDFHKLKDVDTFGMTPETREAQITESSFEAASDPRRSGHFKVLESLDDVVM